MTGKELDFSEYTDRETSLLCIALGMYAEGLEPYGFHIDKAYIKDNGRQSARLVGKDGREVGGNRDVLEYIHTCPTCGSEGFEEYLADSTMPECCREYAATLED